jgi:excisionase family DNA binding protein
MREAAVCKARRGELEITLPAGLEWDGPNGVCLCPDQQVIDTLQMVFDKFDEIGTARQTALWLRDSGVQLPRRRSKSEIHWVEPNPSIVCAILSNPAYAGAYAYGRRRTVQQLHPDGAVQRRQVEVAQDDWTVLINDHHEGLISWERFQKIQQRLMQNYTKSGLSTAGPAREGAALLQGLVYCGKCGRKMHVVYRNRAEDRITQVVCRRVWNDSDTGGYCQVLGQRAIQQRVVELFLQTVQPAGVQVALRALEALKQERDTVCRHWSQCIERADYEANRACQRYEAVDPANRLVAAELERRWNEALDRAASVRRQAEEKLASLSRELSDEEVERVERMAQDVERLWNAPSTGVRDRKRLLRAAIERVVVIGEDNIVKVAVEWKGGEVTELSIKRPRRGIPTRVTPSEVVALVRKLAAELDDVQIARVLSRQGHKTATGLNFTKRHVQSIRAAHQIPCPTRRPTDGQPQHTADQAARELGVSSTTIHQWLRTGILRGHQLAPGAPWRIKLDEETRRRLAGDTAPDGWVGVEQAAVRLGVSKQTVITWVKEGKLQAVRVASGRRTAWRICVDSTGCEKQLALI